MSLILQPFHNLKGLLVFSWASTVGESMVGALVYARSGNRFHSSQPCVNPTRPAWALSVWLTASPRRIWPTVCYCRGLVRQEAFSNDPELRSSLRVLVDHCRFLALSSSGVGPHEKKNMTRGDRHRPKSDQVQTQSEQPQASNRNRTPKTQPRKSEVQP